MLAPSYEQKGQENMTLYNLQYWPCYDGRNVRVNHDILTRIHSSLCSVSNDTIPSKSCLEISASKPSLEIKNNSCRYKH